MPIPSADAAFAATPVPMHYITWSDPSCDWVLEVRHSADAQPVQPHALVEDDPLVFTFAAPADALSDVCVQTATYVRENTPWVLGELLDRHGYVLARHWVAPHEVGNNTYTKVLDLRDVRLTTGAVYTVRLKSPLARTGDCFAVYVIPASVGRYEHHRRIAWLRQRRTFVPADHAAELRETASAECVVATMPNWMDDPARSRLLTAGLAARFPGLSFRLVELDDPTRYWPIMARSKLVVFADVFDSTLPWELTFDDLCFALHRLGVPTLFYDLASPANARLASGGRWAAIEQSRKPQRRCCHFTLADGPSPTLSASFTDETLPALRSGALEASGLARLQALVAARRRPHVVVVSVLYKKAAVVQPFLDHVMQQTFDGEITVVLVNDRSPENDALRARAYAAALPLRKHSFAGKRRVEVVDSPRNLGNCPSRLAGIAAADGDIYIVIDCDCLLNREFVAAHVFEHWDPKVDAVVGPLNIETWQRDPIQLVQDLEGDPAAVDREAGLQDPVQTNGFVNCITRNFSVKARLAHDGPLFDTDFTYSADPDSGFGWEDVEMGYRLYQRQAVIQYTPLAFSVHCTHPSSMPEAGKVRGSMRNFLRLFTKHPELRLAARRWAVDTYGRIVEWADREGTDGGPIRQELDTLLADDARRQTGLTRAYRGGSRRLRVLSYRWHVPHQYELYKLPHDFTLATQLGLSMVDTWSYSQRPLRPNVRMAPADALNPRDFDVAILHFDENVLCSELSNGTLPAVWGDPFRRFLAIEDLPKVAICHGTVAFEGQYGLDPGQKKSFVTHEHARRLLMERLAEARVKVVCNSWQAFEEWGFKDARVIWHGFDPQEFPAATYERDILSLQVDVHRPHYRGAWEYSAITERLPDDIALENAAHLGAALEHRNGNVYATKHFRSYIDRIRQFTVYLNTTLRSPMPRSRGEAMMTGVVPVCLRNHDVDHFIRPGVNGFYADEPEELADYAAYLCRNRAEARRVGAEARRTAMDVFNHDRYLTEWTRLLTDATG